MAFYDQAVCQLLRVLHLKATARRLLPSTLFGQVTRLSQDDCTLLQLPLDIVLLLVDHLPLHARHVLAQTCFPMHFVLHSRFDLSVDELRKDYEQSVDFLASLARKKLNRWVCYGCVRLFTVDFEELSSYAVDKCHRQNISDLGTPLRPMKHEHVELTLKYTRMAKQLDKSQQRLLARLLAPLFTVLHFPLRYPTARNIIIKVRHEPRVVRGRYLLMNEWATPNVEGGVSPLNPFNWTFCRHQAAQRDKWLMANLPFLYHAHTSVPFRQETPEITASCPFCATDIAIQRRRESSCLVRTWTDWGPEASSNHPCWIAHTLDKDVGFRFRDGSVRKLYELADPAPRRHID
jgi:hypothetical protein